VSPELSPVRRAMACTGLESRITERSGRRTGREDAIRPMFSSIMFQTAYESLRLLSGSVRTLDCSTVLTIPAVQALW